MNVTRVRACFGAKRGRSVGSELLCRIGDDVSYSASRLEVFCFSHMSESEEELILLSAVVAFADRSVRRTTSSGWLRRIHVVMPVGSPSFWSRKRVKQSLEEALCFVTGDHWTFEFERRTSKLLNPKQREFALGASDTIVIPFSSGLDSFAQSRLLTHEGVDATPIRLTASNNGLPGDRLWVEDSDGRRFPRVSIPFRLKKNNHYEPSYRTRSFVFAALAGVAAHLAKSRFVVFPEAGQGSFGPSLVPVGAESPHRGSHPAFTLKMTEFFSALWGEPIHFRHPQQWRTKGQVLEELIKHGVATGWTKTFSCSQGARQIYTARGKKIHCGFCSGCLLRRASVNASGLQEADDQYFLANMTASSLEAGVCSDAGRKVSKNDHDIAAHAVMGMESLARFGDGPADDLMIKKNLLDAFPPQEFDDAEKRLRKLLSAHRAEWTHFKQSVSDKSWVNAHAAAL
jgi:hypothetical protein